MTMLTLSALRKFVFPQVKFMDVKLVCVMDLHRGFFQELVFFRN